MVTNKRIAVMADTVVNEKRIASHSAIIGADGDISFNTRYLDNEACKEHRDIVREDRAEVEDLAYEAQAEFATALTE